MKTTKLTMIIATSALLLSACGEEPASFTTQEDARAQAISNAEYNAKNWRNANAPEAKIVMRGDSTIGPNCLTGDGWATVDLVTDSKKLKLKCSTVSGTIGCMTSADFKEREQYASQDGTCNTSLPYPLPKIVK